MLSIQAVRGLPRLRAPYVGAGRQRPVYNYNNATFSI